MLHSISIDIKDIKPDSILVLELLCIVLFIVVSCGHLYLLFNLICIVFSNATILEYIDIHSYNIDIILDIILYHLSH